MKTLHKGFALPALLLLAALAIGGGIFIKERSMMKEKEMKAQAPSTKPAMNPKVTGNGEFDADLAAIDVQLKGLNADIEQSNKTE
jgi:hypothetical protein